MSKTTKIWLIIAACLTVLGILIGIGALAMTHWDFSGFSNVELTTITHEVKGSFDNISIDVETADVVFKPADDGKCKVDCYDSEKNPYIVAVQENTLNITADSSAKWTDRLSLFSFERPKITVFLPKKEYKQLSVSAETGDVVIPGDFSFAGVTIEGTTSDVDCRASASGDMEIRSTTGDISLASLSADNIKISVTTGDVTMQDVAAQGDVTVKTTTGDITLKNTVSAKAFDFTGVSCDVDFDLSDAAQITVKTVTGDITGTLCSDKAFAAKSSSGDVDVPNTTDGGKCELTTNTGDIRIRIVNDTPDSTPDSAKKSVEIAAG